MVFKRKVHWDEELEWIKQAGKDGITYEQIGQKYGVSRERIRQVVRKHIPNWDEAHGRTTKRRVQDEQYRLKWGNKPETSVELYNAQRSKFRAKKYNAQRTGWEWSISFGDLDWPTHCPILGMELDYFAEGRQENSPSFDQIDAGKGYVKGNVHIISWRANRIKNNGTAEEHRKIADYLEKL